MLGDAETVAAYLEPWQPTGRRSNKKPPNLSQRLSFLSSSWARIEKGQNATRMITSMIWAIVDDRLPPSGERGRTIVDGRSKADAKLKTQLLKFKLGPNYRNVLGQNQKRLSRRPP